jgi:uncharacterized membrane protein HdeD (DUF308 family)
MGTTFASLLSRYWWMILLRGLIAVLFGITIFASPGISLVTLVLLFGGYSLVDGIGNVVTAIGGRKDDETWWVLLLGGLAGIGVGILTFVTPGVTALILLFYVAIWAIATGLLQIVTALRLRKVIQGEFWMVLGGIASVIFGVLLIANPGGGALAVLTIIAVYAILFGATVIILALKARRFAKRVEGTLAGA